MRPLATWNSIRLVILAVTCMQALGCTSDPFELGDPDITYEVEGGQASVSGSFRVPAEHIQRLRAEAEER